MGKEEDAAYFAKRADYYKNLFDPETKFMRPRKADGTWKAPFNPSALAHSESGRYRFCFYQICREITIFRINLPICI